MRTGLLFPCRFQRIALGSRALEGGGVVAGCTLLPKLGSPCPRERDPVKLPSRTRPFAGARWSGGLPARQRLAAVLSARRTLPGFPWHDPLDCPSSSLHQARVPQAGERGSLSRCYSPARVFQRARGIWVDRGGPRWIARGCHVPAGAHPKVWTIKRPRRALDEVLPTLPLPFPLSLPPSGALASHQTLDLDLSPQPGQGS